LFNIIARVGHAVQKVEEVLLSAAVLIIAGLTILNVICRSLLGFSLAATEEVAQFCIIVVCFVGLSYAASKGRHIRMTAIYDQLPRRFRKVLMILISASTSAVMFVMAWYAVEYVRTVYSLGGVYPALRVPVFIVYAIAPVGLLMSGIHYGLATVRNLSSREVYVSFERTDRYEEPVLEEL